MESGPLTADTDADGGLEALLGRACVAAATARQRAYAPYSRFRVGAAAVAADGRVFSGANVENASYGLTVCAERVALWSAVAAGAEGFRIVAVVVDAPEPVAPCGACRQVLHELAPDALVVMRTLGGAERRASVQALLPGAFSARDLPP
jgi:cytidine deaminase